MDYMLVLQVNNMDHMERREYMEPVVDSWFLFSLSLGWQKFDELYC
jgi:hypothetical protein